MLSDNSLPNMMIQSKTNNHLAFGIFTLVKSSLQIRPFMQNKANFLDALMNVNTIKTKDYENKTLGGSGKNEPKTNPIKANFKKAKMNVTSYITKDYENKSNCSLAENKPNTKPKQTQYEPNQSQLKPI